MKSLAPQDYEAQPRLDAPAGYICVIRDIDRDHYRIEATEMPGALVDRVIAERERSFGIELVALLRTDDLAASEGDLFERHHARLSSEWLELDALQLEELRRSTLAIDAYASVYLMPGNPPATTSGARPAASSRFQSGRAGEAARRSSRRAGGEGASRLLASRHYGYHISGRRRRRGSADSLRADQPVSARQAVADWIDDQITQNPIAVFAVFVIAALVCFGWIRERNFLYRTVNRTYTVAVESPTAVPERLESSPTPAGKPYIITQRVPVYRCAAIACRRPVLISKGTRIWVSRALSGPPVNGSSVWIEFQLYGEAAYVPISYVEPLR